MSESNQSGGGPKPPTDDDGWGEAAGGVTPREPEPEAAESVVVDDEWSMAAPPAVGAPVPTRAPAPEPSFDEPVPTRAPAPEPSFDEPVPDDVVGQTAHPERSPGTAGAESKDEPAPDEPEPDYAAEADRWRRELRAAVGVDDEPTADDASAETPPPRKPRKPKRKAGGDGGGRFSPRTRRIAIGIAVVAVLIGVLVALGWLNGRDYYLVCGAHEITAERGRGFPPWGSRRIDGAAWKPVALPDNAECEARATRDRDELELWYLAALEARAKETLNRRDPALTPEEVDGAEAQVRQALLLARKPERSDQRKELQRLLGDVAYWRGAAQLRQAIDLLRKAGDTFESAAKSLPRYQSDSASWGDYAHDVAGELVKGPPSLRPERPEATDQPQFSGTGPGSQVEVPDAGPSRNLRVDAAPGMMLPLPADAAPPPPDARMPTGGVLL